METILILIRYGISIDWVVDKGNIINTNSSGGELALLLTETNGGTRLSSTRYVYYGTVTAKCASFNSASFMGLLMVSAVKTGRWGGVVTAFITMSDIKDEIDWEFPGAATTEAQSNYFWQGVIRAYLYIPLRPFCVDLGLIWCSH